MEPIAGKDARDHLEAGHTLEELRLVEGGDGPGGPAAEALEASRVDLVDLIRNGIPERPCIPGCAPWLLAGKRYLIPAPAGSGKSLVSLIAAVSCIEAGGTVAVIDVENGSDEYARRLGDILEARGDDTLAGQRDECRGRQLGVGRAAWRSGGRWRVPACVSEG